VVVFVLVCVLIATRWARTEVRTTVWWMWTIWVQTGLTWVKFLPPVLLTPDERNWFVRWGSGGVVEVTFLLLAAVLSLPVWWRASVEDEPPAEIRP